MCESRWDPEHVLVFTRKSLPQPSAKCWRAAPQIHCNIKDLARYGPDQLPLRMSNLIMQAAQHISTGKRVVVLYKFIHNHDLRHGPFVVAFHTKPAAARDYRSLEQELAVAQSMRTHLSRLDRL